MGHKQQPLRSKGEAGGAFIVISGIVRVTSQTADGLALNEAYLAAGRCTDRQTDIHCAHILHACFMHTHTLQLSTSLSTKIYW